VQAEIASREGNWAGNVRRRVEWKAHKNIALLFIYTT
jgi:hypothetical protein